MWLFQEGERVSSDRLFRVRGIQPHSNDPNVKKPSPKITEEEPVVCTTLQVGDLCVFLDFSQLLIATILESCVLGLAKLGQEHLQQECVMRFTLINQYHCTSAHCQSRVLKKFKTGPNEQ